MAPASWYMTHERAHLPLASAPSHTAPAPALVLPPTAPSTATPEPCDYSAMLLGPRVYARPLPLATSVTTAALLPPPTANPLLVCKESMEGCKYVNLEMSDEEMEEEYESRKKAEWCCGA
uniref:Uncharacterized protein n=1 Tax=Aegilops tauschii TaxID=37682 RepID=N1QT39_AEGTA